MSNENPIGPDVATGVATHVSGYRAGVADGSNCRSRGDTISKLRLVAINDDYSAGFRAGYFQRER